MVSYRHARTSAGTLAVALLLCALQTDAFASSRSAQGKLVRAEFTLSPRTRHVCLNDDSYGSNANAADEEDLAILCHDLFVSARALDGEAAGYSAHARLAARLRSADVAALLRLAPPSRLAALYNLRGALVAHAARVPPSAGGGDAIPRFRLGSHGAGASDATDARGGVCLSAEDIARGLLLGGFRIDFARSVSRSTGGRSSGDRRSGEAHHGMLGPSLRTMPELARLASVALPQPIDPRLPDLLRRPSRPLPPALSDAALAELLSASSRRAAPVPLPS